MPIFEYLCQSCGSTFERILRNSSGQESCPRCGGIALRRVSATAPAAPATGCAPRGGFS